MWYILKQLFTAVLVKVMDIYLYFGEQLLSIITGGPSSQMSFPVHTVVLKLRNSPNS